MIQRFSYQAPIGPLTIFYYQSQLYYLSLTACRYPGRLQRYLPEVSVTAAKGCPPELGPLLDRYFAGQPVRWTIDYQLLGTPFQRRVWQAAAEVPYGQVTTYKCLAARIGTKAYRAVGQALGANPLPLLIPCHRITASDGLGGFSSGLEQKRRLLALEGYTCC